MKKILLSLITIIFVIATATASTAAYFTDSEVSVGNTFTTGTIDIAVNGSNPWTLGTPYALDDMKPSQTDYIEFVVHNVGTNPVNLYKTLASFANTDPDGTVSESECEAEHGTWTNSGGPCVGRTVAKDVQTQINYDMRVELYSVDPSTLGAAPFWWEDIYLDSDNKKLDTLLNQPMYLGMVPVNYYMKVIQSYHMIDTGNPDDQNQYQSDTLTFDINLVAEQLGAHALRLENKDGAQTDHTVLSDSIFADLTYKTKDKELAYSLTGTVPLASTNYSLIAYHEAWSTPSGTGWPRAVTILGAATSDGSGAITMSDSVELTSDLLSMKVWLVPTSDLTGNTMSAWNPANYLLDTGLMDYYDADL